ncbi:MAG TPA: sulfatase-like hydrolase/transferase [Vicinamibacterales bacterium]|nr:sulfatase-like hydrolase/transferase [Vicinamibacterales bacterium]
MAIGHVLLLSLACTRGAPQIDLRAIPGQNVLLITIDTLRADALGSYGGRAATPALDRLAAEGVRFDFAHAHAVVTLTSHASILTGRYPFQHGLRDNSGYRLPSDAPTLASRLKAGGYATGAFVAAFPLHSRFGLNQGFDVYDDHFGETRAPTELVMPERPATAVVPLAREWIAARQSGRWFAWVHLFDPHAPYRPPPPFDAQYASRPYDGEVAAVDAALAPLIGDVRSAAQPTLVIVTADHGESLGEHGEASHGLFAYESTLRVPLIVSEIGSTPGAPAPRITGAALARGEVSSVTARHVDILPTILDAVGLPPPSDLPGRSLLPATERRSSAPQRPSYFEAMGGVLNRGWAPLSGVLANREKLVDLPILERYDLATDPAERTNLAGRAPERDRALEALLHGFNATAPAERPAEDVEAAARLRALGYVSGSAPRKEKYDESDDPKRLIEIDQLMHRAVEAFGAGRAVDAAATYREVITRRPDMAIAYRHLAFLEAQQGDLAGAIRTLQGATRAGVTDRHVLTLLGGYLADSGRVEQGIRVLEPLARSPDADSDTLNTLGIAYAQARRPEEARSAFERVLAVNPNSSVPLENLGMLALERDDLASARARFESAVAADPRSSRAHAGVGVVALRSGDRPGAIAAWKKAVDLDPANADALYNLGTTLARDGQTSAARPFLEQFLRVAPPPYASDRREVMRLLRP